MYDFRGLDDSIYLDGWYSGHSFKSVGELLEDCGDNGQPLLRVQYNMAKADRAKGTVTIISSRNNPGLPSELPSPNVFNDTNV